MLSVCNLNNDVALFCVCVVCFPFFGKKTKCFFGLHLVVLFFSWLFCVFLFFYHSFQKKRPQKTGHCKIQKKKHKKAAKKDKQKIQLAQLCSQIVFLIFWGWATKM